MAAGADLSARRSDAYDGDPDRKVRVWSPKVSDPWGPFEIFSMGFGQPGGDQALAVACGGYGREAERARMLLSAGADPNDANRHGITPLMAAARCGLAEVAEALVAAGADLSARDARGVGVAEKCAEAGKPELAGALGLARARREARLIEQGVAQGVASGNPARL